MSIDWASFDADLDAHQARLADEAEEARERSYKTAAREDAAPAEFSYADLIPGDFMSNEGPNGRWVKVVEVRGPHSYVKSRHANCAEGEISVLFEIPESVSVSGETRYWITRPEHERVLIDMRARPDDIFWLCRITGCTEQRRAHYSTCATHKDAA